MFDTCTLSALEELKFREETEIQELAGVKIPHLRGLEQVIGT